MQNHHVIFFPIFFSPDHLRGSGPERADTLSVTIVCLIIYLLTLNFQLFLGILNLDIKKNVLHMA